MDSAMEGPPPERDGQGQGWSEMDMHAAQMQQAERMFNAGMLGNDEPGQRAYRYLRWLIRQSLADVHFDAMSRSGRIFARGRWRTPEDFVAMANEDGAGDSERRRWGMPG